MSIKSIIAMTALLGGGMPEIKYNERDRRYQNLLYILKHKPKDKRNMTDEWIPLEETLFDDTLIRLRIDTRDFHTIRTSKSGVGENNQPIKNIDRLRELDASKNHKLFFTILEIKEIITDLYNRSGGKREWRFLALSGKGKDISYANTGWNLKYLSIIKTKYGYLIYDNKESRAIFEYELKSPIYSYQ